MNIFNTPDCPESFKKIVFKKDGFNLGKLHPYSFYPEITRGCNLRCSFCATRLFPPGKVKFMSRETWLELIEIISIVNPNGHIQFANAGEPTLNPLLIEFIEIARRKLPGIQMELYTNGFTLINGKVTYGDLFNAGLNAVFVDVYHPIDKHIELAKLSGYDFYAVNKDGKCPVNIFTHRHQKDFHFILLSPNPGLWKNIKKRSKNFSTFLNNLDWEAALKLDILPVKEAPNRRCDQPTRTANIMFDGSYTFCCQDMMREVSGSLGNTKDGVGGFYKFWFGSYMQTTRYMLFLKLRNEHPLCKRCCFISGRADIPLWDSTLLENYWDGENWKSLDENSINISYNNPSF